MARPLLTVITMGLCISFTSLTPGQAPHAERVSEITEWLGSGTFSPTPRIEDREFWGQVGTSPHHRSTVADAEELLRQAFHPLPDELYLEYSKNGNRSRYERVFFAKLDAFRTLVVAECIENQGRFLRHIQDLVASYAADKSWVLPAHDGGLDNFEGRQITIDLFASEVACELGTAVHLLGRPPRSEHTRHSAKRGAAPHL